MVIHFKYSPGATPIDLDEAIGLIPNTLALKLI